MATIDKLNTVSMTGIDKVDTISLTTIEEINTIAVPSGFTTDYSVELNGSSQYIDLGNQTSSALNPSQSSINTSGNQTSSALNPSQSSINTSGLTLTGWVYIDTLGTGGGDFLYDLGNLLY